MVKLGRYVPLRVGAFLDALGNAVHTHAGLRPGRQVGRHHRLRSDRRDGRGDRRAQRREHGHRHRRQRSRAGDRAPLGGRAAISRNLHAFNVRTTTAEDVKQAVERVTDGVGVDVVCEMSGSSAAINFALDIVRMGGMLSLLGLPAGHSVTIDDYTRNVIFKGVTMQGIIGRRMYSTWQRMLALLRSGLDVEWVVQAAYDSLQDFHEGVGRFDRHEALKVVFFPEGEAREARLTGDEGERRSCSDHVTLVFAVRSSLICMFSLNWKWFKSEPDLEKRAD